MKLIIISAFSTNGTIGKDNALPWKLREDLRMFKTVTEGCAVIMGRKTYESIGKPLPKRKNIVITNGDIDLPEGVIKASSPEHAIELAERMEFERVFVAGGSKVYESFLPLATHMYITHVHADVEGDTVFPAYNKAEWIPYLNREFKKDANNEHDFTFTSYLRK